MILLVTTESLEVTSCELMDWIEYLGGRCARLNGEDVRGPVSFELSMNQGACEVRVALPAGGFSTADIGVVIYRGRNSLIIPDCHGVHNAQLREEMESHMRDELTATLASVHAALAGVPWIGHPSSSVINKMLALKHAASAGLRVPETILTNSRDALSAFVRQQGRTVTKPASDSTFFRDGDLHYGLYTELLEHSCLDETPPGLFPCLAQKYIEKEYEIRTFYLEGRCYSMAIFSQLDTQTQIDFRRYNYERFNRCVPFQLPADVESRIDTFMKSAGLTTGSLDLIRSVDGQYVFLEVNPVGRFGFISESCNYLLEKKVAECAIEKDRSHAAGRAA